MPEFQPHSDKQELAIFSDKRILLALTGIQFGKGLDITGKILTSRGYVEVGLIRKGEVLYDRRGNPTRVTGVYPQGVRRRFRINFTDRKSLITDDSHRNVLRRRCGRPETVMTTLELFEQKNLWGLARVPSVTNPIQLPHANLPFSPYILGALLGDGTFAQGRVEICLGPTKNDILERVRDELPSGVNARIIGTANTRSAPGYAINDLRRDIEALGLGDCLSATKFVPDIYKFSSPEQRLDVLRGLMDTDGTVNSPHKSSGRSIEYTTVSKQLAEDVIWLVESLGGKAWYNIKQQPKYRYKGEVLIGQPAFRVNIILKGYNCFWLPRKAELWFAHENTTDKVIASVEELDPGETVCFSVDSRNETFIANDQIVTHNTTIGAWRMKLRMHEHRERNDTFIIASPNYKIMQQSTLPAFLEVMRGCGEYSKADAEFRMHNGGTCFMRTATEPDSIVGIRRCRGVWLDEAGKMSLYFWENAQARASPMKAPIDLTTTPYAMNWVYKELVRGVERGIRDDIYLMRASSKDNPYFPADEYEQKKKTMDPRRFNAVYGGEFDQMSGRVYPFCDEENVCEPFTLPVGTEFVAGVDWGFTHPFVIQVRAITPDGRHYQVSELYKTGYTLPMQVKAAAALKEVWGIKRFYCGPDQPGSIMEFNRNGLTALPANNDIRTGVDVHYELIASRKFKIFKGSGKNSMDEYEMYHWPEPQDLRPDQNQRPENPVKQFDDAMDCARYLSVMTHKSKSVSAKKIPKNPEERNTYKSRPIYTGVV